MNYLKKFLRDKRLETWLWESGNALIALVAVYLIEIEVWWAIPVVGFLNQITKYINIKYLKK